MDLQCKLITHRNNQPHEQLPVPLYDTDCLGTLDDAVIPAVIEYAELQIAVMSDTGTGVFELPELEDYGLADASQDVQRFAFNRPYTLFSFEHGRERPSAQDVPLIPGYYTVKVHVTATTTKYGYWRVRPKDLSTPEWQTMRADVEQMVKGLARDYTRAARGRVRDQPGKSVAALLDDETTYLLSNEAKIRYAVEALRNNAKYRIDKTYTWIPAGGRGEIDQITMRKVSERPDKQGMLYAPTPLLAVRCGGESLAEVLPDAPGQVVPHTDGVRGGCGG